MIRRERFSSHHLALAMALCLAGACAPRAQLRSDPGVPAAGRVHLAVPFFPDNSDQCGPSVLASLLNFWSVPIASAEVRDRVYVKRLKGTFPLDMAPALRAYGLNVRVVSGSFDLIRSELNASRPLIAYLDFGTARHPIGHYVVITGYDQTRGGLYVHSALNRDKFASYRRFNRGWKDTDHWLLLVSTVAFEPTGDLARTRAPVQRGVLATSEHLELAALYDAKGWFDDAKTQYQMALASDPRSVEALNALGTYALQHNNMREAEKYLRRALKQDPNHGAANNNLAMVYVASNRDLKRAERLAQKATATPMAPYAYDTLSQLYLKQGKTAQAQQAHQHATAATSDPRLLQQLQEQWTAATDKAPLTTTD